MDFNSPIFLFLFLPGFFIIYYIVPGRIKLIIGIVGSLLFYAWGDLTYIPVVLGLVVFSYLIARSITKDKQRKLSRLLLWAGILANISLIVGFKLLKSADYPLGLSYLTFQAIAFIIEVYTDKLKTEGDFLAYAFYLLLFPKIPVGPIVRYSTLREQIQNSHVDSMDVYVGIRRFIIGLAKKILIADTLARVVNPIFNLSSPTILPSVAWLVLIGFSLQLYFDFSGFTDMSLGLGRMMGLRFAENFNYPYISKSIGDFWRRWHISLSSWFRDFVFYPLERRRFAVWGQSINILIVFLLTGLWHGISVNYVIWGLIHGFALVFEGSPIGRKIRSFWQPLQHLYALGVILVGWVFFRSPTPHFALVFLRRLAGDLSGLHILPFELTRPLPFVEPTFVMAFIAGIILVFPLDKWLDMLYRRILIGKAPPGFAVQVMCDLGLIIILVAAIAVMAGATFSPGIYETF